MDRSPTDLCDVGNLIHTRGDEVWHAVVGGDVSHGHEDLHVGEELLLASVRGAGGQHVGRAAPLAGQLAGGANVAGGRVDRIQPGVLKWDEVNKENSAPVRRMAKVTLILTRTTT